MESCSMYSLVSGFFCSMLYLWDSFILLNIIVDGSFSCCTIFHCANVTILFIYSIVHGCFSSFHFFGSYKWSYEYCCMSVLLNMLYEFMLGMYLRVEFLGNEHIHICSPIIDTANIFQSGSHQQCMKVLVAPDFC